MDNFIIGTNWKMHKTVQETKKYIEKISDCVNRSKVKCFIIPPYTALFAAAEIIRINSPKLMFGAQNMHWMNEGAFTGEISPVMLSEIGVDIIEIGHSERRNLFAETDENIEKKVKAAIEHNFIALICIGEKKEDKTYGIQKEVLAIQIKKALNSIDNYEKIWIAYEPVWAIGEQGVFPELDYICETVCYIKQILSEVTGRAEHKIPVLYGGSINTDNFKSLSKIPGLDGLFIGRDVLNEDNFIKVVEYFS